MCYRYTIPQCFQWLIPKSCASFEVAASPARACALLLVWSGRWQASADGPLGQRRGELAAIWLFCAVRQMGSMSVGVGLRRLARRKNAGVVVGTGFACNRSAARNCGPILWCRSMYCAAMKRSPYRRANLPMPSGHAMLRGQRVREAAGGHVSRFLRPSEPNIGWYLRRRST